MMNFFILTLPAACLMFLLITVNKWVDWKFVDASWIRRGAISLLILAPLVGFVIWIFGDLRADREFSADIAGMIVGGLLAHLVAYFAKAIRS